MSSYVRLVQDSSYYIRFGYVISG